VLASIVVIVFCVSVAAALEDYDIIAVNKELSPNLETKTIPVKGGGKEKNIAAYYAFVSGVKLSSYSPRLQPGGCAGDRVPLSVSAKYNGCTYATNGGFFNYNGPNHCECSLIIDGVSVNNASGVHPYFAITRDEMWIVGYLDNSTIQGLDLLNLISGNCWLVRDGKNVVADSQKKEAGCSASFVNLIAPRTAIGVHRDGSLLLLQVEGIEDTSGMDLNMFAELLISLDAWAVVNIDGGGSSTSYYDGKVINTPHCNDNTTVCERDIASLICVKI